MGFSRQEYWCGVPLPSPSIMHIFDWKINFDALFKFSHITPSTQQHLKKVSASFVLCMFVVAAGAYVHVVTHFIQVRAVFFSSCCGINCIRKKLAQQGGTSLCLSVVFFSSLGSAPSQVKVIQSCLSHWTFSRPEYWSG